MNRPLDLLLLVSDLFSVPGRGLFNRHELHLLLTPSLFLPRGPSSEADTTRRLSTVLVLETSVSFLSTPSKSRASNPSSGSGSETRLYPQQPKKQSIEKDTVSVITTRTFQIIKKLRE